MPYKEHHVFQKPDNVNQKIWRYLENRYYLDLLDKRSLCFSRLDLLGDKFEGSITKPEMQLRRQYRKKWVDKLRPIFPKLTLGNTLKRDSEMSKYLNKGIFVNCWHMNEHESNAMWKPDSKYAKDIAIQSTYMKLRKSFDCCKEDVFIGKTTYKDLTKDIRSFDNLLRQNIRKEQSFDYERELRAVIIKWVDDKGNLFKKPFDKRIFVSVNLDVLIDRIVVSPTSSVSVDKIRTNTQKHNLSKNVEKSVLATEPLF